MKKFVKGVVKELVFNDTKNTDTNMVLIVSESNDISTNLVIEWISYLGYSFYRLNPEDQVDINNLSLDDFELIVNGQDILKYSDITSTWFRRGFINFKSYNAASDKKGFMKYISNHLNEEQSAFSELVHHLLYKKRHIGTEHDHHINKFIQLDIAKESGLGTPSSYFVKRKSDLEKLISTKEIVTKSSNYVFDFVHDDNSYLTYTEVIKSNELDKIPELFFLSYCQEHIKKICDIRTFYLNGKCFSMAIMSQRNPSTEIDFRKYDFENPNKSVSFKLPIDIEIKVATFMKRLNLISGSIDFILDRNGEFIFLEVNPVGQFGMVDYPCNYGLNKEIANFLTHNNN